MGHIIVTGAGSGLGRALTIGLVERGHRVSMMGRRYHKLQEQEQRLGSAVVGIAADLVTYGKVVGGVARRAHARGVPVFAIVGDVGDDAYGAYDAGVSAIFSINRLAVPRDEAKARSHIDYTHTLDDLLRCIRAAEQFKR